METIINQIKTVLDKPLKNIGYDFKNNYYKSLFDTEKGLYSQYFFNIRKKIWGEHFFIHISLRIHNTEIAKIAHDVKIKILEGNTNLTKSFKLKRLK
jgi:hypothetical protein